MLEFLQSGNTATTKGLYIPIPNLPNSFTEDYLSTQSTEYKNGRFILSALDKISEVVTGVDFLSNPNETNKLGISISKTNLRVDADTEDRIITIAFNKILNTLTGLVTSPDIGDPVDETFPTGKFTIQEIFPLAQLLNVGDQVSYTGIIISESVLTANGLASLTLSSDGLKFVEAFLKGIYKEIPSQSGTLSSVILPYVRPRVVVTTAPFNDVRLFFDGTEPLINNLYNVYLMVNYSLTIRTKITSDRATVSAT